MKTYVLDFETFYDSKDGYTLKKLTTEEYINDPRFHAFGFSVGVFDGKNPHNRKVAWVPEAAIEKVLNSLDLENSAVICHNAAFDLAILNWKYGIKPKFCCDTLSMARILLGPTERLSLEALAERFGVGQKGKAILNMDGVRFPSADLLKDLAEYAILDSELTHGIYYEMGRLFPNPEEFQAIDFSVRMYTEPSFVLDESKIKREIFLQEEQKKQLLASAGCTMEDLRSDNKFAQLLIGLGVEPPKKLSVKKSAKAGKDVYAWAFAKSDADFKALANSDNEMVRYAVEARLGLKTTIKASRAERFAGIAERMGVMPIALDYAGANTHRYAASSSAKVNAQNLPAARGSEDPDAALLRKALVPPKDKAIIVTDLSQIEARMLAWLSGQTDVVESFAKGGDVYSEMASEIFSRPIDRKKVKAHFIPGFIGKSVVLGCGYGLGHVKFGGMIYSGMLGMKGILFGPEMVEELGVDLLNYAHLLENYEDLAEGFSRNKPAALSAFQWLTHLACSKVIIDKFRQSRPMIPRYWKTCEKMLESMWLGQEDTYGPVKTIKDAIILPNGMPMHFKELERDEDGDFSCLRKKEGRVQRVNLYGGKVAENVCQALTGVVIKSAGVRMAKAGFRPILQVHDEYAALGGLSEIEKHKAIVHQCMVQVPYWATGLPIAAETSHAMSYGDAK